MQLSFNEQSELLDKYRSEVRKLDFERSYILGLIRSLEAGLKQPTTPEEADEVQPLDLGTVTPAEERVKRSAKPRQQQYYGFKLSEWDHLMLDTLEKADQPMNSGSLLEVFETYCAEKNYTLDDKQLRNALSRTVHKLANIKNVVKKEDFPGKGFCYSMPE
jgi:hypothetical protein